MIENLPFECSIHVELLQDPFSVVLCPPIPFHQVMESIFDGHDLVMLYALVGIIHDQRFGDRSSETLKIQTDMFSDNRSKRRESPFEQHAGSQFTVVLTGVQTASLGYVVEKSGCFNEFEIQSGAVPVQKAAQV